ncbi:PilN domain-containing protein [Ruminiclostridium herbifermentans]|uniref:PilN domain-containing protein n=1 Tax=Ruminiclostridium herbifermentans TaxID=2488810 RepID=A0A4U7JCS8_9FIRM|nr:PilN domain-containing protein [Ruminiclostridium herbifermentans]QNU68115.1 PilN domain-containing protein [Ruminiclostridium herbifermentans]
MKDLNLIPANYVFEKKSKHKKALLSILIVLIAIVFVSAYIFPTLYENNLKNEKAVLIDEVAKTNIYVTEVKEFNTLKQAVEAREKEGISLAQRQFSSLEIMNAIENASPEKVFVQKMDISGDSESNVKVSLSCIAENEETIAYFIKNIKDDAYFKKIGMSTITKNQENNGRAFDLVLEGVNNDNLTKYYGWDQTISIGYIPDWVISEEKDNRVLLSAKNSLTNAEPASLEILRENTELQVKAFADERQSGLRRLLKNYKLEYSSQTRNSKLDAIKSVYSYEDNNIKYTCSELCVVKDGKCYIVTYKCDSVSFTNTEQIINRIIKSFNIN